MSDGSGQSLYVPEGAEIATTNGSTLTLTQPANQSGTPTLTAYGDNGGTQIRDASGRCWYKTNYRGDPHEFGAYGDGKTDDTVPVQNWFGAYGTYVSTTAGNAPANFGPWIATIPANYKVSQQLYCPFFAVLQGTANITSGTPGGMPVSPPAASPAVRIFADHTVTFPSNATALLTANSYCRISGLAIDAMGVSNGTNAIDAVDIQGTHIGIDNHSLIENGNININCPGGYAATLDGLQVKESQIQNALSDGIHIGNGCSNVRLIGDIVENNNTQLISGAYGSGIFASGKDLNIQDGIVEGNNGRGVYIYSAFGVKISGMTFAGSGTEYPAGLSYPYPAIDISGSIDITLSGSLFQGTGTDVFSGSLTPQIPNAADILFSGNADDVTISGNVHQLRDDGSGNATPAYIFDVFGTPQLSNIHIYETPEEPAVSLFSAAAQPVLGPSLIPQFTRNQIGGLTMTASGPVVQIAAGSAADSTNSTIIQIPQAGCQVNLNSTGAGGLDLGGGAHVNTTYFIYVIAAAVGSNISTVTTPNCMASTSPLNPSFTQASFHGSGYFLRTAGGTVSGSGTVYNVGDLVGVAAGNMLQATSGANLAGAHIKGFTANDGPGQTYSGTWTGTGAQTNINLTCAPSCTFPGVQFGMQIVQTSGNNPCLNSYIVGESGSTITANNVASMCTAGVAKTLYISGVRELVTDGTANATLPTTISPEPNLDIGIGYYRLIGAVVTNSNISAPGIIPFIQNDNTFYLAQASPDISASALGMSATPLPLASVPNGVAVEAFGRCTSNQLVHLSTPTATNAPPATFNSPPGYDTYSAINGDTSFPFRLYTDAATNIAGQSSSGGATLYCMTDGWVFNR